MGQVQSCEAPSGGVVNGREKMRCSRLHNFTTLVEKVTSGQNPSHRRLARNGYGGKRVALVIVPDFREEFSNLFDLRRIKLPRQKIRSHGQIPIRASFGNRF